MTGVPVQGAGTDDEMREAILAAVSVQHGCDTLLSTSGRPCNRCRQSVDALLSDTGVLAAMQRREQEAAAKALQDAADDYEVHGGAAGRQAAMQLRGRAVALDPNGRPDQ